MNRWTHFVTITYSDEKHTETEFRAKLRKCLSNLHTRHKWRYMGVFERAPETGRLHFHALVYVPENEMIGTITEKQDYSTKQHKMQTTHENDFFLLRFGRNDFEEISLVELKHGNAVSYLLKYIEKTGEKITYSRGIPAELHTTIDNDDIASKIRNFVLKYVLFDDVIDWERDIQHYATPPPRGYEPRYIYWRNGNKNTQETTTARTGRAVASGSAQPPPRAVVCTVDDTLYRVRAERAPARINQAHAQVSIPQLLGKFGRKIV